ncbi:putative rRNA-processing protein EBP2-like protein [Gossypium australe]|uniref:Putative rRNA-processing protein EBP2-like protein n=1 Tax=Gossypium australe TaxID=47621 RepID=A0A5B6UPR7_9ROSI|nr:putative rRNA-processing protein EBP2-like protein [Gossypium australe]
MGFQIKESSLQAENTVDDDDDDVMEDFNGEESESGSESDVKLTEYWPENVDWMHKLPLDTDQEKKVDVNDDSARQLLFYTQALEGTRLAFEKFQSMGLPFLRPPNYYANIPTQRKAKQKKQEIEAVKKWRKQRQQNGFRDRKKGLPDLGFEDSKSFERSSNKTGSSGIPSPGSEVE